MLTKEIIHTIENQTGIRQKTLRRALNKSLRAGASIMEDRIKKNDILRMPIKNFIEEVVFEPIDPMMEPRYQKEGVPEHHDNWGGASGERSKTKYSRNWSFQGAAVTGYGDMIVKGADGNYYLFTYNHVEDEETDIKYRKINLQKDTYEKLKTKKENDPRYTEVTMGLVRPGGYNDKYDKRKYKGISKKIYDDKKVAIYREQDVILRTRAENPKQLFKDKWNSNKDEKKYNKFMDKLKSDILILLQYYKNNPKADLRFKVLNVTKRKTNHGPGMGGVPPKYDDIFHDVSLQMINDVPTQNMIYDITFSQYRRYTYTDDYNNPYTYTYPSIPQQAVIESGSKYKDPAKTKKEPIRGKTYGKVTESLTKSQKVLDVFVNF